MYRYDDFDHGFVAERASQFRGQVERRLSGALTEEQFKPLRLHNGLYLQLHAYMLRIAIPYGTLNPRQCRVVALPKPNDRERTQWYFQRYATHLPAAGEIALFDRSWYNRAGVEKVMGYCTAEETLAFLKQAPVFEKMLVDEGILLFKYWLTVDQALQEERFAERRADPLKRWKLSPIDLEARARYADYTEARNTMLQATHGKHTPWTLVNFNDQRRGRLALIRDLLARLPDHAVPEPTLDFPPLPREPLKERFKAGFKPI